MMMNPMMMGGGMYPEMNQFGMNPMGMNQMGMNQMDPMNQMGMNQIGMGQMGMNQMGMNQMGMNQMGMNQMQTMGEEKQEEEVPEDPNAKLDYYGEKLYTKISSNENYAHVSELFSRIVGIFLDLEEEVIQRLIQDDKYFDLQVRETIRLLAEQENQEN